MYQEILVEIRPDVIIETGSAHGGSGLFLASMCDTLKNGEVLSIDIAPNPQRPGHPRLTFITGSSTAPEISAQVRSHLTAGARVLVILDSDHSKKHVLAEMKLYGPLVTPGSYLIVEDTNLNGHPVFLNYGDGPFEAVQEFLKTHPEFAIDKTKEKYLMTQNPGGYLKRLH